MKKFSKSEIIGMIMLLIATMIWGLAFVAQKVAADNVSPFYLNGIRFCIGSIILFPFSIYSIKKMENKNIKKTIIAGVLSGLALCAATNIQQFGIEKTNPGVAGFLTAMYIIYVPVFSILIFKKKINYKQLMGIILAVIGTALISFTSGFSISSGDVFCLLCGIFFAIQILIVDYFVKDVSPIALSNITFIVSGILSLIIGVHFEEISFENVKNAIWPILFMGILSTGIAYTFQIIGQKKIDGIPATLIMSLESVFSVIFTLIILKQYLSLQEAMGCVVMFIGVILVQIFQKKENVL